MIAYLFPGQGSQHRGMGGELFDQFRAVTDKADALLGYSIRTLCIEDPGNRLTNTMFTQPAVYVVNALTWMGKLIDGTPPDVVAGHSLGEFNALLAAGVINFETGLKLVQQRASLMAKAPEGTMMAVLGIGAAQVETVLREQGAANVDLANDNAPDQVVLAGAAASLEALIAPLTKAGAALCKMLPVGGAFHSRAMEAAAREFAAHLDSVTFAAPKIPVIANVTAEPYPADSVAAILGRQMRSSVQWRRTMDWLRQRGVSEIVEVGPGRVLAGLHRANSGASVSRAIPRPMVATAVRSQPPLAAAPVPITAATLGAETFRRTYRTRYAYVAGAMYSGIASPALVVRMGKAGLIGFLGSGGLRLSVIEDAIRRIQDELRNGEPYGVNLLHHADDPALEAETADLLLRCDVRNVEAAAYMEMTAPLVHFRFKGAYRDGQGRPAALRQVMAKVSRPEVARAFLNPPPDALLRNLVAAGKLSDVEAAIARELPVSEDLCVEADSGGHTDGGVAYALMPAMRQLRDELVRTHRFRMPIRLGAAGGIGTPLAAAAAFMLGADFILTGSINQCSPEAGTSDAVKDMLQRMDVQDTAYAPAGDMFELGAKVQVMKKGVLFPGRANKLHDLYRQYESIEAMEPAVRDLVERRYLRRGIDEVWADTRRHYLERRPAEIERAERNPKHKMALIFKWYFARTTRLAVEGDVGQAADFQVHCGPAMGAFNRFARGTDLESWRARHVDVMADRLMRGAAAVLTEFYAGLGQDESPEPERLANAVRPEGRRAPVPVTN
jgi:trans-AT polyketide synthase/acyltransferase/oxidoreductase domain-containing protein